MKQKLVLIAAGLALGACVQQPSQQDQPGASGTAPAPSQQTAAAAADPDAPHIYMAIQPGGASGPTSVVFAIDRDRNNSPANDPAIRITPENGQCNPQEMQFYNFPGESGSRPIFGPQEAGSGVSARELPNFMAMAVTSEMLRKGLIVQPDDSKPQNVCTRKLWEQLVVNESTGQG